MGFMTVFFLKLLRLLKVLFPSPNKFSAEELWAHVLCEQS